MALEDLVGNDKFFDSLVRANPTGADPKSQGDDHIRGIKNTILNTWPLITGAVTLGQNTINNLPAELAAIDDMLVGMVAAFPLGAPNGNWLLCDGFAIPRDAFPKLRAYLGDAYGNGNGTTTYNLPDYRGEFLRGHDDGAGNDPDADARTDRGDGTTGDERGTKQAQDIGPHTHVIPFRRQGTGGVQKANINVDQGGDEMTTDSAGGTETRPRNVAVAFYIFAGAP